MGTPVSSFRGSVRLKEWWLVKSENEFKGKRLAVEGFTYTDNESKDGHDSNLFTSSPIVKRHDIFTLETADGITVYLEGSINRFRSIQNGFSPQACDHFFIGFPFFWEEPSTSIVQTSNSGLSNSRNSFKDGDSDGKSCKQVTKNITGDALKDSVLRVNAEVTVSSDVEPHTTKEILNRERLGGTEAILNTTMEKGTRGSRINRNTSNDHSVPTKSDVNCKTPYEVDSGIPANSSKGMMRLKAMGILSSRINTILSPKSAVPSLCSSVPKDSSHGIKIHVNMKSCDANFSNLSRDNLGSVKKELFASPDDHPLRGNLRNWEEDVVIDNTGKDVPSESVQELNHRSIPATENSKQNESSHIDQLKSPVKAEVSLGKELVRSQKAAKKKLECIITNETSLPLTRNRRKAVSCVSPDYFSCKKSKSGRLIVPPLQFWRNEKILYDLDGQIVGVPKGMPQLEGPAGCRSVPVRKKKKLT